MEDGGRPPPFFSLPRARSFWRPPPPWFPSGVLPSIPLAPPCIRTPVPVRVRSHEGRGKAPTLASGRADALPAHSRPPPSQTETLACAVVRQEPDERLGSSGRTQLHGEVEARSRLEERIPVLPAVIVDIGPGLHEVLARPPRRGLNTKPRGRGGNPGGEEGRDRGEETRKGTRRGAAGGTARTRPSVTWALGSGAEAGAGSWTSAKFPWAQAMCKAVLPRPLHQSITGVEAWGSPFRGAGRPPRAIVRPTWRAFACAQTCPSSPSPRPPFPHPHPAGMRIRPPARCWGRAGRELPSEGGPPALGAPVSPQRPASAIAYLSHFGAGSMPFAAPRPLPLARNAMRCNGVELCWSWPGGAGTQQCATKSGSAGKWPSGRRS